MQGIYIKLTINSKSVRNENFYEHSHYMILIDSYL